MIFRESAIRLISRWKAWFSSSSRSWSFGAAAAITSWCSASSSATFWSVGLAVAWGCEFPGDEGLDLEEVPDLLAGQGCHYEPLPWHDLQEASHAGAVEMPRSSPMDSGRTMIPGRSSPDMMWALAFSLSCGRALLRGLRLMRNQGIFSRWCGAWSRWARRAPVRPGFRRCARRSPAPDPS